MLMLALDRETEDLQHFSVDEVLNVLYDILKNEDDEDVKGAISLSIAVLETLRDNGEVDNTEDIAVKSYLLLLEKLKPQK